MGENVNNNKLIRAEKTSRSNDDKKVLFVGFAACILLIFGQSIFNFFDESRWFRDLTNRTPFHSVEVLYTAPVNDGEALIIKGTMVKRRCEFQFLTGYIIGANGARERVHVNTTPEDVLTGDLGSRPSSEDKEVWGPWVLSLRSSTDIQKPYEYEIFGHHICPKQTVVQSNLFTKGLWTSYTFHPEK